MSGNFLDNYSLPRNPFDYALLQRPTRGATRQSLQPVTSQGSATGNGVNFERPYFGADYGEPLQDFTSVLNKIANPTKPDAKDSPLDKIEKLLRSQGAIFDKWGGPGTDTPDDSQAAAKPTYLRAPTPYEGPDTGDPELSGYFSHLRPAEGGEKGIDATNPVTGAAGTYQFLPSTWASIAKEAPQLGLTPEGIRSEAQQARAADYYTRKSLSQLVPHLGRQPSYGELYALHFLGHTGGMQLLKNLDAPVSETVSPAAIDANPWVRKYKTGRALLNQFERMLS